MPILVPARPGERLLQGDVLRGKTLYFTKVDGETGFFEGEVDYLLVISRDCLCIRAKMIAVLPIGLRPLQLSGTSFEEISAQMEVGMRGGRKEDVDSFYMGPIENGDVRHAANLALPFTIRVPHGESERQTWVDTNRVRSMHPHFVTHLHERLFRSFARAPFEDHGWFPDEDLALLIGQGELERDALVLKASEYTQQAMRERAAGNERNAEGTDKKLEKVEGGVAKLNRKLAPLQAEAAKRAEAAGGDEG